MARQCEYAVAIYGIVCHIKVIGANMNINPISIAGSFIRHESDLMQEAKALKDNLDNSILLGKTQVNKVHHLEEVANKVILDSQNTDPYWINSVNRVADISRHNYVFVGKVV